MSLKERFSESGKKILQNPAVLRWMSDDRVMKAAEGLMDAPGRMKAAWRILLSGHDLPNIDPALDESMGEVADSSTSPNKSAPAKKNGVSPSMQGSDDMKQSLAERSSLSGIGGK
ncbi:MAG TPA: hypothetical protein PKD61_12360, partial [Polyangiaceae bacterium]|nr:hypothetical protein [Polyangiaceae bacterium]